MRRQVSLPELREMMSGGPLRGLHGLEIGGYAVRGCLEFENCTDILVRNLYVEGGNDCLRAVNCTGLTVSQSRLFNPTGRVPHGHCFIFDKCEDSHAIGNRLVAKIRATPDMIAELDPAERKTLKTQLGTAEDLGSIYNSVGCTARNNRAIGFTSKSGTGFCIDGESVRDCSAIHNVISGPMTGITVGGGSGHVVAENVIRKAVDCGVRVANYYRGVTRDVDVQANRVEVLTMGEHRIWIDPNTTRSIRVHS